MQLECFDPLRKKQAILRQRKSAFFLVPPEVRDCKPVRGTAKYRPRAIQPFDYAQDCNRGLSRQSLEVKMGCTVNNGDYQG